MRPWWRCGLAKVRVADGTGVKRTQARLSFPIVSTKQNLSHISGWSVIRLSGLVPSGAYPRTTARTPIGDSTHRFVGCCSENSNSRQFPLAPRSDVRSYLRL